MDDLYQNKRIFSNNLKDIGDWGYIENIVTIELNEIITDTLWTSPRYHENAHSCKVWPVVIIFKHR